MIGKFVFSGSDALLFASALMADTKDLVIGAYFKTGSAIIGEDLDGAKNAASDLAHNAQPANNGAISKCATDSVDGRMTLVKPSAAMAREEITCE